MTTVHPADLKLADAFAAGGAEILPDIEARLQTDRRDSAKTYLIYALLRMNEMSYYSVAANPTLLKLIRTESGRIKDPEWRDLATEFVREIVLRISNERQ